MPRGDSRKPRSMRERTQKLSGILGSGAFSEGGGGGADAAKSALRARTSLRHMRLVDREIASWTIRSGRVELPAAAAMRCHCAPTALPWSGKRDRLVWALVLALLAGAAERRERELSPRPGIWARPGSRLSFLAALCRSSAASMGLILLFRVSTAIREIALVCPQAGCSGRSWARQLTPRGLARRIRTPQGGAQLGD